MSQVKKLLVYIDPRYEKYVRGFETIRVSSIKDLKAMEISKYKAIGIKMKHIRKIATALADPEVIFAALGKGRSSRSRSSPSVPAPGSSHSRQSSTIVKQASFHERQSTLRKEMQDFHKGVDGLDDLLDPALMAGLGGGAKRGRDRDGRRATGFFPNMDTGPQTSAKAQEDWANRTRGKSPGPRKKKIKKGLKKKKAGLMDFAAALMGATGKNYNPDGKSVCFCCNAYEIDADKDVPLYDIELDGDVPLVDGSGNHPGNLTAATTRSILVGGATYAPHGEKFKPAQDSSQATSTKIPKKQRNLDDQKPKMFRAKTPFHKAASPDAALLDGDDRNDEGEVVPPPPPEPMKNAPPPPPPGLTPEAPSVEVTPPPAPEPEGSGGSGEADLTNEAYDPFAIGNQNSDSEENALPKFRVPGDEPLVVRLGSEPYARDSTASIRSSHGIAEPGKPRILAVSTNNQLHEWRVGRRKFKEVKHKKAIPEGVVYADSNATGIWATSTRDGSNVYFKPHIRRKWTTIGGACLAMIASDNSGNFVLGTTRDNDVLRRDTQTGSAWVKVSGKLQTLSVSRLGVWGVGPEGECSYAEHAELNEDYSWQQVDSEEGQPTEWLQVDISDNGEDVWAISSDNRVFYRHGITEEAKTGDSWTEIEGQPLVSIGVGEDVVWGIGPEGNTFARAGFYENEKAEGPEKGDRQPTGNKWLRMGETEVSTVAVSCNMR